ncbi:MAG: hypothetical protein JW808_07905 [Victivallales bacterium]|nr:hypothetical protein [Victivallales bacterium]
MSFAKARRILFVLLLTIPVIAAISVVQSRINTIKTENNLTDTDIIENAPPIVAFVTVVMGSFRGLLANILWLRTNALQEEGKYYEMVQLASWITKLQPRFTGATAYLAWNMAYNISVTCSSHEDRWRWVQKGIELIRDEALVYNPGDPILYKELGWIYQHKIGNIMDDANQYYKNQLANQMMAVFGKGEPDWERMAAAPDNEEDLMKTLGTTEEFWNKLMEQDLDFREKYTSFADIEKDFKIFRRLPQKVRNALGDDPAKIAILDNYMRAKWLKEAYKLDAAFILDLNRKYGDLDWRLPEAHAIYWASKGIENDAKGEVNVDCERMITQSLKDAFMGGRLLIADQDKSHSFMTIPNLAVADAAIEAFRTAHSRQEVKSFHDAMRNFMKDIIVVMYTFGKYSKAESYYRELRKENPDNPVYRVPLDDFVMKEWREDARDATPQQAYDLLSGLLFRSMYMAAAGEQEQAEGHLNLANSIYNIYQDQQKDTQVRMGLEPFDDIKKATAEHFRQSMGIKPMPETLVPKDR